jgi:hypothetical protein
MEFSTDHHIHNGIILAVSTFGAIISKITGSGIATGLTILLALVGLASYWYSFVVKRKENHNYELEKKKLELEIQELQKNKKRKPL